MPRQLEGLVHPGDVGRVALGVFGVVGGALLGVRALLLVQSLSSLTLLLLLPGMFRPTKTMPPWTKRMFSTNFSPGLPWCSSVIVVCAEALGLANMTLREWSSRSRLS